MHSPSIFDPRLVRNLRGFTLIELMIAMTLSLFILFGLVTVIVNNSQTRKEIERTTRQIESGRYATELVSSTLRHAGFLGEFDPTPLPAPGALPDPCSAVAADVAAGLTFHVQGYRESTGAGLSCLPTSGADEILGGNDILVVRRAGTCVAGTAGCDALTSGANYYFQASLCNPASGNAELAGPVTEHYRLSSSTADLDRHQRTCVLTGCDCTTAKPADIRRYLTHIYYIAKNNVGTDGVPTLKRAELTATGFAIVPLVDGIQAFRVEYGLDTDGDGLPDAYTGTPDTYACATCNAVANWRNVVAAKVYILARNTEASGGFVDSKTYKLGSAAALGPFGDAYRRQVFSTSVKMFNVAGRRGI